MHRSLKAAPQQWDSLLMNYKGKTLQMVFYGPSAERSRTASHIAETVGENMQGGGRVTDRAIA